MKKITLKSLLVVALAIIPMTIFAQRDQEPNNYWTIGIEGGATQLFGDNTQFQFDQTSWNAGLFFGYTIKSSIYMYANLGYVNLKAVNKGYFTIDESNLIHANINIGYDVLQLFRMNPHRLVAIVPHWGVGIEQHRTTTKFNDGSVIKTGYKDSMNGSGINGRRNVFQNEFGLNFIFNFTKHFRANIDIAGYKTDSDYLDNVGGANHNKHNDWYATANIGIAYKFHNRDVKPCPECPECEPAAPDCDACSDAIKQAVKDAVEEAMKNHPCEEAEPEESKASTTEAVEVVPFKNTDLDLTFKVGSSKVEDTKANREEIQEISDDINSGMQFSTVKVEGYASPEGNDEQNQKLSEDRANATVEYIQEKLGNEVKDVEFQAEGMGSDWDGFFAALEKSNISNKAEIANSIKNAENPTAKLNELRTKYTALESLLKSLRKTKVSYIE
jgi:outer membrane protein OmpA-like peptidoglycan-associated protein